MVVEWHNDIRQGFGEGFMKTLVITGASSGIGAAIAERFIDDGFRVINLSRRACPVAGVESIACDLLDTTQIRSALERCTSSVLREASVCLVHNAALMRKDRADNCATDQFEQVLRVSLLAVNSINQAMLPHMGPGSSVIYVGSTLSEKAVSGSFSYVVSKHAQLGMMRATCQDLMGTGIHTGCVCPGFTDTEMLRDHLNNDEELLQSITAMNGFGRLVQPSEIADVVSFVHHNPVINGTVIHANLGQKEY